MPRNPAGKQIEASRRSGAKSYGPYTAQGKLFVSVLSQAINRLENEISKKPENGPQLPVDQSDTGPQPEKFEPENPTPKLPRSPIVRRLCALAFRQTYRKRWPARPFGCGAQFFSIRRGGEESNNKERQEGWPDGVRGRDQSGSEQLMSLNVLYTAHATATGGRNGHTQSDDGLVSVDLSVPKVMGGPGKPGTTTPEDLFAAGYAACFGGACEFMGLQMKLRPKSVEVRASVSIGTPQDGGFGLAVAMDVKVAGLSQADAEKIVAAGHAFCPYSKAIQGNVGVTIKVTAV